MSDPTREVAHEAAEQIAHAATEIAQARAILDLTAPKRRNQPDTRSASFIAAAQLLIAAEVTIEQARQLLRKQHNLI